MNSGTAGRVYVHAGTTLGRRRSSGGDRTVAERTVKVAAVLELDGLKTLGDLIHANGLVAIMECLTIRLGKFSASRSAASWALQIFSPFVARGHR